MKLTCYCILVCSIVIVSLTGCGTQDDPIMPGVPAEDSPFGLVTSIISDDADSPDLSCMVFEISGTVFIDADANGIFNPGSEFLFKYHFWFQGKGHAGL